MVHIDKYKKNNGYYDEDDCFYECAEDFLQMKIFGFCGCGHPDENLKYIRDGLIHLSRGDCPSVMSPEQHSKWFDNWVAEGNKIFGNEKSRYFFFYWCDKEELTEHGGSIPGWLTDKGKEMLEDLIEFYTQQV